MKDLTLIIPAKDEKESLPKVLDELIKFNLKKNIILKFSKRLKIVDLGPDSNISVDYPIFAKKLTKKVSITKGSFGILVCGSGMGMSITANKIKNI